ncbi:helix-turn-helix transcriptional regulator [Thetidibacter halocola]|uniref:Helix-turn-helix transcriptional regulator n=1 Tax=Thetidibacter halocola TaxID=2827239 RepID=A0A8J7WF81_9RHOB|nr:helix-turn-helix transcriptional regulator [Thetidibacter halocola]MBS0126550.1 helix-turn-helix transcriptional regulator [Thetidibacter halocola]
MTKRTHPHAETRLAKFIDRRILELAPRKSQRDIALEAGFKTPNVVSMIKSGATKLPLDRVPAMAAALEVDPRHLFNLALEQVGLETTLKATRDIFNVIVTQNEAAWLEEIRDASDHTDPRLTQRARAAIRGIFGK